MIRAKITVCTFLTVLLISGLNFNVAAASGPVVQLSSPDEFSPGATTIDFEGFSGQLSNQITGLTFAPRQTYAISPALIGNSPGIPLYATTSGDVAAFSYGGSRIDFQTPITEVGMFVSPKFITVTGSTPLYLPIYLTALDSSNNQIGSVSVRVLRVTGNILDIQNFKPVFIALKSEVPISALTIDWESSFSPGGVTFYFDDLIFVNRVPGVEDLLLMVENLELPENVTGSLASKLEAALDSLNSDRENAATGQLNAFINQIEAQRGKKLTNEQADTLIATAQWILSSILN